MKKIHNYLTLFLAFLCLGNLSASADGAGTIKFFRGEREPFGFHPGDEFDVAYQRAEGYKDGVTLIAACYDGEGRLENIETVSDELGSQSELSVRIQAPAEEDGSVRAMLFDSLGGLRPLCSAQELQKSTFYHPVYKISETEKNISGLKKQAEDVIKMTDEQIKAVIPKQTPIKNLKHPTTKGTVSAIWNPFSPDIVTDGRTGSVFPSEAFPNNCTQTYQNLHGHTVEISSYQDNDGTQYYMDAFVDYQKQEWLRKQLTYLSKLYHLTGGEEYAHKTALILYEWSKYNPEYLLITTAGQYVFSDKRGWAEDGKPLYGTQPYGWQESRNGTRWQTNIDDVLLQAYDLTYYSRAYEELGAGARNSVEDKLLAEHADLVLLQKFYDPQIGYSLLRDNLISFVRGFISTGRVLERPEYVHYAYKYCEMMAEYMMFTRDSFWIEGSSYFTTLYANFGDVYERFDGYTDPPGYVSGITGKHISDANKELAREQQFLEKGYNEVRRLLVNPMGVGPFVHDSWSLDMTRAKNRFSPLEKSQNVLLDGFGEAILGTGAGANQTQTRLHFSEDSLNHAHGDMLNLTLTAFGRYDIDDIGYYSAPYRAWTVSDLAHNTVVVDKNEGRYLDNYKALQKGNVTLYDDDEITPLIQVNDNAAPVADGRPERPELFRRTVAQNGTDEDHPYVVDIFEVSGGGKIHDYVLHGTRFMQQTVETDAGVRKMSGERPLLAEGEVWKEPTENMSLISGKGYGVFTNVSEKKQPKNSFYVDFRYNNPYEAVNEGMANPEYVTDERVLNRWKNSGQAEPFAGLRAHFVLDDTTADTTLYIGDTPSFKLASLYPNEPPQTRQAKSLILRRQSDSEGLSSRFVTVLEPYEYSRSIEKIEQLAIKGSKNAVALKICMTDRDDIVIIALDGGLGEIRAVDGNDTYAMDGRYAVISSRAGEVSYHLYGGSVISVNGSRVYGSAASAFSGDVLSISSGRDSDNMVKVEGTIPDTAAGKYMFVNFADGLGVDREKLDKSFKTRDNTSFAYQIERVVRNEDGTSNLYLAEESGIRETFAQDGKKNYTEIFYNWRVFSDKASYTIY